MPILINLKSEDLHLVKSVKKDLAKGFREDREEWIDKANELAVCMYCLNGVEEASIFLDSYLSDLLTLNGEHRAWSSIHRGGTLLALCVKEMDVHKYTTLVKSLYEHEYDNPFDSYQEYFEFIKTDYFGATSFFDKNGNYREVVSTCCDYYLKCLFFSVVISRMELIQYQRIAVPLNELSEEISNRILGLLNSMG